MKKKPKNLKLVTTQNDKCLFLRANLLLMEDLSDPQIETAVRGLLLSLRKRGYSLEDTDIEDADCLLCLHLALQSAAELTPIGWQESQQENQLH